MDIDYSTHARRYLEASRAAIAGLEDLRAGGPHDPRAVAQHYDRINQGMKLAEVCAQIAIAEKLGELVELTVAAQRLTPDEVDALVSNWRDRIA